MRILLLGDFSSLYTNLKEGLEALGHTVVLASTGDGWKNTKRDIDLSSLPYVPFFISKRLKPLLMLPRLRGFDVVQFINPFYMKQKYFPNRLFFEYIANNNGKFYLSAAGDDAYFWRYSREILKYSPLDDYLKYDVKSSSFYMESDASLTWNHYMVKLSDGVIPIMYEYEISHRKASCKKLLPTIPIPMNMDKIEYKENIVKDKIIIFHGLNRYGFKGTKYVEEAFKILKERYPNDLELIIEGNMPLEKYLKVMEKSNVIIDQTNSYSLGVNGVYALAMGKVVLGGAEKESLESLGIKSSPVINIEPNAESIVHAIEKLLEDRKSITCIVFIFILFYYI